MSTGAGGTVSTATVDNLSVAQIADMIDSLAGRVRNVESHVEGVNSWLFGMDADEAVEPAVLTSGHTLGQISCAIDNLSKRIASVEVKTSELSGRLGYPGDSKIG